jgi:asparagine synthase (glutamine-hydrolysing)
LAKGYGILPGILRTAIRNRIETTSLLSGDLRRKLSHTFLARENTFEAMQLENFYSAFTRSDINAICSLRCRRTAPFESVLGFWQAHERSSTLSRMLYTDQKTYLTELLMRQDQMSMAWSIESRVPFLDHPLVEFAMRVPDRLKIHRGERKFILKKAVENLLPKDIIYRKKMGFPTPLRQWFRDPGANSLLMSLTRRDSFLASILDVGQIERLLINDRKGVEDGTDRIWRLLNLQLWGDIFLKGKSEAPEIRTDVKSVDRMSKAVAS